MFFIFFLYIEAFISSSICPLFVNPSFLARRTDAVIFLVYPTVKLFKVCVFARVVYDEAAYLRGIALVPIIPVLSYSPFHRAQALPVPISFPVSLENTSHMPYS